MKLVKPKFVLILVLLIGNILPLSAQNVTNVEFWQDGKNVKISYDLDKTADIKIAVSTDGGKTFSSPLARVTGDVGNGVASGKKVIVWDVLSEYDKLVGENICFRVTAEGGKRCFTVNGVSFNMIHVDGGTFTMGATSEQQNPDNGEFPTHRVSLSSYYIGETEVTQLLWEAVMGNNPSRFEGGSNPVEQVSWKDSQKFVSKLSKLTGATFRLPTEAEWEFAARGGNKSRGYQYSGSSNIDAVAWHVGNSGSTTHPVATKQANELGIYDMSGNVLEWCQDLYGGYQASAQTNPAGPSSGFGRVFRGGSWYFNAGCCRSAYRDNYSPSYRFNFLGIRLVLSE